MIRLRYVAAASFLFTLLFFIEYTPIFRGIRKVHIPFDLEGFHYPLADYAFQALHQGRFPQWDPAIYCGLSFAGNMQAALFYPPMWLLFAANWGRTRLTYQGLEYLDLAHVWLAFLLCYLWLYRRRLHPLACALGGCVRLQWLHASPAPALWPHRRVKHLHSQEAASIGRAWVLADSSCHSPVVRLLEVSHPGSYSKSSRTSTSICWHEGTRCTPNH